MAHVSDLVRSRQQRRRFGMLDLLALYRQRRDLARLSDAQLSDLGLSRDDARAEASRPVWDVPAHWTC